MAGTGELLATTLRALEAGIAADLGLTALDRLDLVSTMPEHLQRLCFVVSSGGTTNTGQYRDAGLARVDDEVIIEFAVAIDPRGQRASRDDALLLEERVRTYVTRPGAFGKGTLVYASTQRGPHPADPAWYVVAQNFTLPRDAALGGHTG